LQWIKKNIKYFKGDKNNITIAGESAGSFSVSNLICSPAALAKNQSDKKPLFHKAIMESGCL
jgi:para-nitrobenzyl esterase